MGAAEVLTLFHKILEFHFQNSCVVKYHRLENRYGNFINKMIFATVEQTPDVYGKR